MGSRASTPKGQRLGSSRPWDQPDWPRGEGAQARPLPLAPALRIQPEHPPAAQPWDGPYLPPSCFPFPTPAPASEEHLSAFRGTAGPLPSASQGWAPAQRVSDGQTGPVQSQAPPREAPVGLTLCWGDLENLNFLKPGAHKFCGRPA